MLGWYDLHARDLPWRTKPGQMADPYRVWLSEVMLQQTTVATVRPRLVAWVARWPDVASLAAADEADVMAAWAGLGYYARARNLVKTARAVMAKHGGRFPVTESELRTLPGLGAYTAAAVAAIAFGERAVVVDANVQRVVARLRAIGVPLPAARPAIRAAADAITPAARAGDFAQAMMDLGATICTPRKPRCLLCPLREECAGYATGMPERFPVKGAKKAKPQRFGTVFWIDREGASGVGREVLLVTRAASGLLGGMRALPTGPWGDAPPGLEGAPAGADWRLLDERVRHSFTHFDLQLALAVARVDGHVVAGQWWPIAELASAGLPTLFAKAARVLERVA
ncbi:A/G-specific adenine glycosylase [Sphingomonas bacterium]|uniref:A/G-specific adenine glycosylase n=1 Tax=Sphingomonas bacterium TaxID=1895847 RepID=UPI002629FEBB|nr:A/G-specific adenine glycosylase [Sphingomonas bacterium]